MGRSIWTRAVDGLFAGPVPDATALAWRDHQLWHRVVAGLFGYSLVPRGAAAARVRPAVAARRNFTPGAIRLPRFDRAALRMAATAQARRGLLDTEVDGTRYVLRDLGGDRLGVIIETSDGTVARTALLVTVQTPGHAIDYLLPFMASTSGRWLCNAAMPGLRTWADVTVGGHRPLASLGAADADLITRSVRVAAGAGIAGWLAVAEERPAGDPVRAAIERGRQR